MSESNGHFPRPVFDANGTYTVRTADSYLVDDSRVRELADIVYARRDLAKAYDFLARCLDEDGSGRSDEFEEALWVATVVFYAKPFGRNHARGAFDANAFLNERLSDDGRRLHEYLRRLRHRWAAHDDGLGEDKTVAIYLPPSPPQSFLELGLHAQARRVISPGTEIARQVEPHVAWVRDILAAHETQRRDAIARELIATRFHNLQLMGIASSAPLAVDLDSVLRLPR
ncbi:hypothetical protein [Silanimonas sp.]|uniref:hypothetical protein n=1 Tax=Silanimonas sp. TaxID=1929290 RepID=UPI0022C8C151|nr:hypothetical protein [Silanimonas sp.]MCZ8166595.1 hypothetical protein [Silanimonas sp.]